MKAGLSLERTDLLGLRALLALSGRELDPLVLLEIAEAIGQDGGVVHEDVGASVIWCDESVTLARVEPLNGSRRHVLRLISDLRDPDNGARAVRPPAHSRRLYLGLSGRPLSRFAGAVTRAR